MTSASESELAAYFQEHGLDKAYWLPKFEELGVKNKVALQLIEGDVKAYNKLSKQVRRENLVEKKGLKKILKIDSNKQKQEQHEKEREAQQKLQDIEKVRSEQKQCHDTRVEKFGDDTAKRLEARFEPTNRSLDEFFEKGNESLQGGGQLQAREKVDHFMLLQTISGGQALQGILLTKKVSDQLQSRNRLLEVPKQVILCGASNAHGEYVHFTSIKEENEYRKIVNVLGSGFAVSGSIPVYGNIAISGGTSKSKKTVDEESRHQTKREMYLSTVRYATIHVASYSFEESDILLSKDAKKDLTEILHTFQSLRSYSTRVQKMCERFFNEYGSHVNKGPLQFGGTFCWTACSHGFTVSSMEKVKHEQIDSISTKLGLSAFGIGISAEKTSDKSESSSLGKHSEGTCAEIRLDLTISGGPPEVTDISKWKEGLVNNKSTWILTSRGNRLKAVWDIIRTNHHEELGELEEVLRKAWEEMTGLKAEPGIQISSYDSLKVMKEVCKWNDSEEVMNARQIKDNLEYLLKVRKDILDKGISPNVWICDYLSKQSLQEFLASVIRQISTLQVLQSELDHIKFLMQQLIEKDDLTQLTTRNFPAIDQVSQWLYESSEQPKPSNHEKGCVNFESFEKYLQKTLEEKRIDMLGDVGGQATNEDKKLNVSNLTLAIHYLRSHYYRTNDDVLIFILVNQFKAGYHDGIISLKPMSLNDLERLHSLFTKNRETFNKYAKMKDPICLQACLFNIAMDSDVCSTDEECQKLLQQVKQMMSNINPSLKLLVNDYIHDSSYKESFKEELRSFMNNGHAHKSSLATECDYSLEKVLKTVALKQKHPSNVSSDIFDRNLTAHNLFKRLGLCDMYLTKLQVQDALCIRQESLRLSLKKGLPTDLKQLPFLILHKIMSYDCLCRSDLMPQEHQSQSNDSSDDETDDESCDEISDHSSQALCVRKEKNDHYNSVHPVDCLLALILCSDDFLRQDLFSRLSKCQMSVPFMLRDPFTKQLIIPLWAMRSIVKEWKCISGKEVKEYSLPIISNEMPIVSFIRLGSFQKRGASKSKMVNDVISDSLHDHFFYRDCPGAQFKLVFGEGLVDMCWYLPAGESTDTFQIPLTFLNLHGDARQSEHADQAEFLSQISSMCFVLVTEKELELNQQTIQYLKKFSSSPGGLTVLSDVEKTPKALKGESLKTHVIKLSKRNADEIKDAIRQRIKRKLQEMQQSKAIEAYCRADSDIIQRFDNIFVDEDCFRYSGLQLAQDLIHRVKEVNDEHISVKEAMLPLQSVTLWQAWAKKDKEAYRQIHRGNKTVNDYTAIINREKADIRLKQLNHLKLLTPVMESFIKSLLKLSGSTNRTARKYYLECLKLGLNNISRKTISLQQQQYHVTRKDLAEAKKKLKLLKKESKSTEDVQKVINKCKKSLEELQKDIINASFGLEHLFRELGQVFEAAHDQQYKFGELSRLPKAAAELLTEGFPLELMDGDAAHVPQKWVSAVIEETVKMLNDPSVYVLSVLGLQSTGKSTMLNTTFGLQFNVSAGRCTRGAFMQLLPLDKKLVEQANCDYVLVVDTEGLRAPELDSVQTQKHDNELATFVIGLANITLINIYGEVPGDMDDILQTSVHAFIRMNQVKCTPSCKFVHQNAGASAKGDVGRDKFTEKLNKFTVDAAKEENCIGQFETFSDVIAFDDQSDVHHFPGLWKGDPPMAPVNKGYSESAQRLKYDLIEMLLKRRSSGGALCLSSFQIKLVDLCDALLKENFVFSFRNTLEITAYNSLETEYSMWSWKLRYAVQQWEQSVTNEISSADPTKVQELVENKCEEVQRWELSEEDEDSSCSANQETIQDSVEKEFEEMVKLSDVYKSLKKEMEAFFKQSEKNEILIQWKAKFEIKLWNLLLQLKEHAVNHCKRIGSSRKAITEFEKKREQLASQIRHKVDDLIANLKKEQKELNDNLEAGELNECQLKKLLEQRLFTLDTLKRYKRLDILSNDQVEKVSITIITCGQSLNVADLRKILRMIPKEQVKKILKQGRLREDQLKVHFDGHWIKIMADIQFVDHQPVDIKASVQNKMIEYVHTLGGQVIDKLKKISDWGTNSDLVLMVEEKTHYEKIKGSNFIESASNWIATKYRELRNIEDPHQREAQKITCEVLNDAKEHLEEMCKSDTDYSESDTVKLLRLLDESIKRSAKHNNNFRFVPTYRLDVFLIVCGYAVEEFKKMAEKFKENHDPRLYLERKLKGPLFTTFKNQYYQTEAEEAIANSVCAHLKEPIRRQIESKVGSRMVAKMKESENHFRSKMALKVKILEDLHERDNFDEYMMYATHVRRSFTNWIRYYTVQYCDQVVSAEISRFQLVAKEEVTYLIRVIENKVGEVNETDPKKWLQSLSGDDKVRKELGLIFKPDDVLTDRDKIQQLKLENFKSQVIAGLQALKEDLHKSLNDIKCEHDTTDWKIKDKPYDLLMDLAGCTEQCPFCGEQCDLLDADHDAKIHKHRAAIHRPECLTGFKFVKSCIMSIDFCPADVAGEGKFCTNATNDKFQPFRDYAKFYPDWSIEPDPTSAKSLYWMSFVSKYNEAIAHRFGIEPASIPKEWAQIQWEDVKKNLKSQYNLE